jgi:CO/xanthine dehydrogenase Mo-binding subunit
MLALWPGGTFSLPATTPRNPTANVEATDFYNPPRSTITNATHIAQVAIDPVTGLIDIERYVVVHDCGPSSTRTSSTARFMARSYKASAAR